MRLSVEVSAGQLNESKELGALLKGILLRCP
jgi:hypothetical protein